MKTNQKFYKTPELYRTSYYRKLYFNSDNFKPTIFDENRTTPQQFFMNYLFPNRFNQIKQESFAVALFKLYKQYVDIFHECFMQFWGSHYNIYDQLQ